jgi:hypothetical protein
MMLLSDLLLGKAQNWWYHKELRRQGKIEEAQDKERRSVLSTLRDLKDAKANGGFCTVGRGGWTLHPRAGTICSNYGGMESEYPRACLMMGIPLINSLTVPGYEISKAISFPMASLKPSEPPWGWCSFAPFEVVAALYACLGATLYNIQPDWDGARTQVRNLPETVINFLWSSIGGMNVRKS